jgi:hypothetical protein
LLDCWIAGLLDCWIAGLLDCWIAGLLDCWIAGLLDCWIAGLLPYPIKIKKKASSRHLMSTRSFYLVLGINR